MANDAAGVGAGLGLLTIILAILFFSVMDRVEKITHRLEVLERHVHLTPAEKGDR